MRKYLVAILICLLAGCSSQGYRDVDHKVVCDPKLKQAYYVQPGIGDSSFLRRSPQFDELCK